MLLRRIRGFCACACAVLASACAGGAVASGGAVPSGGTVASSGAVASDGGRGEDDFSTNTISRYTATSDGGMPWTIRDGSLVGDGRGIQSLLIREYAELDLGWVETTTSHADDGGLVLGYVDNANYYLLSVRDDEAPSPRGARNLAVYQRIGGSFQEVWTRDVRWPRGTPRTFRFEMAGPGRVRVLIDGEPVGEVSLKPNGGTGFGLRHYGADGTWKSRFDVLRWQITDDGD